MQLVRLSASRQELINVINLNLHLKKILKYVGARQSLAFMGFREGVRLG